MNELIPLMVIVPLMAALLISAFSKFNKATKIFAFVVAICLPLIPLLFNYGLHYFGGYESILDNVTGVAYHPAITYSFTFLQQIFIGGIGLLTFLVIFIYLTKYREVFGSYLFLLFLGTAAVTAIILTDDIFHMFVYGVDFRRGFAVGVDGLADDDVHGAGVHQAAFRPELSGVVREDRKRHV